MFHRWAALVLVLALCAISPKNAAGQNVQSPRGHGAKGKLGISYPNPFNPDTYLTFAVGEDGCVPGSGSYVVTFQLVNVLGQVVTEPILYDAPGTTPAQPAQRGKPIHGITLKCGNYVGYWNGKLANGREAASGVYGELVFIDGEALPARKIYYKK